MNCPHCGEAREVRENVIEWRAGKPVLVPKDERAGDVYICDECHGASFNVGTSYRPLTENDLQGKPAFWLESLAIAMRIPGRAGFDEIVRRFG